MKLQHDQLPLYFEGIGLKRRVVAVAWPVAAAAAVAGVLLGSSEAVVLFQVAGVALVAAAAVLVAALVRCRTFEITVGERLLSVRTGPLRSVVTHEHDRMREPDTALRVGPQRMTARDGRLSE